MDLSIDVADPGAPDVAKVLEAHLGFAVGATPEGHVYALDVRALRDPAVTFFAARSEDQVLGIAALRELEAWHGEIKSMHTTETARGRGIARALLTHLLEIARARGYRRVSLETGAGAKFAAARALYRSAGFAPCEPFGAYTASPNSTCMAITLAPTGPDAPGPEGPP